MTRTGKTELVAYASQHLGMPSRPRPSGHPYLVTLIVVPREVVFEADLTRTSLFDVPWLLPAVFVSTLIIRVPAGPAGSSGRC